MHSTIDQDLLEEIRYDIKVKDLLKGRLVLAALKDVRPDTQKKALLEVARAEPQFAVPLLIGVFVNSPDIARSFPRLKETMYSKVLSQPEVLLDLLAADSDENTRIFLAQMAGDIRLKAAVPLLMALLNRTADPGVREAAIVALGMIGNPAAVQPIGAFLDAEDTRVVIAAVNALGELATAEAVQLLWERLGRDPELDRTIITLLAKAQTPEALEKLNATLVSQYAHIRTAGKQKLSEIGVISVRVLIKNLLQMNPDLVIHSLNVLGDIGDEAAVPAIRKLLHHQPQNPNVRFAAYETLGRFPVDRGAFTLAAGLEDPVDNVRAAAARAINRNYNAVLAGGIRNLTRVDGEGARRIIETIIVSQCENIFMDLLEEDYFQTTALDIIAAKVHPEIRTYYADILRANGFAHLAERIAGGKVVAGRSRRRVFAADDSRMMLNIYRTVLHNLGFDSTCFEFPEQLIATVKQDKPDAVLTDLNMPKITGIELTASLRQIYSKQELPIIMVTTQNEAEDNHNALASGINGILRKPFTESQIGNALQKFAGFKIVA